MTNVYTLKIIKQGQIVQRKQITTGMRKVGATFIQAEPNLTYVLQTPDGEKPITKIVTRLVGKDLHLTVEDGDIKQPQIIIQDYAEYEPSSAFATTLKYGNLAYFNAESDFLLASVSEAETSTLTANNPHDTVGGMSPWVWAGLGGVAIAASQSSKSSGDAAVATTPTAGTTAFSKITSYASTGTSTTPSATPSATDYNDAGFASVTSSNVGAINNAITAVKADSDTKVTSVVTAYLKILNEANGTDADATSTDPLLSDYQALGVQPVNTLTDAQKNNYLGLLNDAIKTRLVADVSTVTKLSALSSIAEKIILVAAGNTGTSTTLAAADFATLGLSVSIPNSVLMTAIEASSNDGSGVNSLAAIKAMDTAYAKISAAADGTKANAPSTAKLTVLDLTELGLLKNYDVNGVTGGTLSGKAIGSDPEHTSALNLLNDVLDGKASSAVATAADINKISIALDKIMDLAKGATPSSALTTTDLTTTLGLTSVTSTNLQKVIANISATQSADGALVDSLTELQSLVGKAVIETYTVDQTGTVTAPTLQDYKDAALAPAVTWTENLKTGVNSVLSSKHTFSLAPDIALSYESILNEATSGVANTHTDPTAAQYSTVLTTQHVLDGGVIGASTTAHDNALSLTNEVIAHKAQLSVDTIGELENLVTIVDHLINTTAATTTANLITLSELTTLGLGNAGNSNLAYFNQSSFNAALRATDDSGSAIHTWADLQLLVNAYS